MATANDIRKGNVVRFNGEPHQVLEVMHRTPGNLRAFVQAKMRSLKSGKSTETRFSSTETVEILTTEARMFEFSYKDSDRFHFMDQETYEQVEFTAELIGDVKDYLVPNSLVNVLYVEGEPLTVDLPASVVLTVVEAPEAIRGNTATNVLKTVIMETGLKVQAPAFVKTGDKLKVSTADASYQSRA